MGAWEQEKSPFFRLKRKENGKVAPIYLASCFPFSKKEEYDDQSHVLVEIRLLLLHWLQSSAFNFTFTLTLTSGRQGGASNSLVPAGRCASAGLKLK